MDFRVDNLLITIMIVCGLGILGSQYIRHLEAKDKRHIELCLKLDCVSPKLRVPK